jgi:hypothetical protein
MGCGVEVKLHEVSKSVRARCDYCTEHGVRRYNSVSTRPIYHRRELSATHCYSGNKLGAPAPLEVRNTGDPVMQELHYRHRCSDKQRREHPHVLVCHNQIDVWTCDTARMRKVGRKVGLGRSS